MSDKQIVVSEGVAGTTGAAALRYLVVAALGPLVASDTIPAESVEGIASLVIMAGTVAYGLYRTWRTKKQLVVTAEAAPNSVAVVK